jgi:hypothetical protein
MVTDLQEFFNQKMLINEGVETGDLKIASI